MFSKLSAASHDLPRGMDSLRGCRQVYLCSTFQQQEKAIKTRYTLNTRQYKKMHAAKILKEKKYYNNELKPSKTGITLQCKI